MVSPILSNIYLDKLDQFAEMVLIPACNHGKQRKPYPPYMALLNAARREADVGRTDEAWLLRRQAQQMPSRDPNDPHFRRLWYVRYADDFLLGFSGPREEAEQIKLQLEGFLRDLLKLELSQEKTLITHGERRRHGSSATRSLLWTPMRSTTIVVVAASMAHQD